jgi:hypothetical protein
MHPAILNIPRRSTPCSIERIQVVPVLPFSLRDRSGVPEEDGASSSQIDHYFAYRKQYNGGTRSSLQYSGFLSSLHAVGFQFQATTSR